MKAIATNQALQTIKTDTFRRERVFSLFQIICASLFIGLCAQIKIPLYFTPIPLVGQTFAVILVGALLGSKKGALAALCYLVEGSLGLPVWAGGASGFYHLMGLTGGYRLAYPLQAFLIGLFFEKQIKFNFVKTIAAFSSICCLQLAIGSIWLIPFLGLNFLKMGFYPFVPIEILKSIMVAFYFKVIKNRK